jgi:hypothetical protein
MAWHTVVYCQKKKSSHTYQLSRIILYYFSVVLLPQILFWSPKKLCILGRSRTVKNQIVLTSFTVLSMHSDEGPRDMTSKQPTLEFKLETFQMKVKHTTLKETHKWKLVFEAHTETCLASLILVTQIKWKPLYYMTLTADFANLFLKKFPPCASVSAHAHTLPRVAIWVGKETWICNNKSVSAIN